MEMTERAHLPAPEAADARDIRWALETAQSLWNQGDRREALQWVRRAAEAAAESGADDRALMLAKMGAELRGVLDIPRTLPPPKLMPDVPPPSLRGDGELVVTVVSTDGSIPAPDACLVSHRALRVAVLPGGNGDLLVRVLSEGQVAPSDSKVALLVALEPGASPLPVP
jgi:hypothetical protein